MYYEEITLDHLEELADIYAYEDGVLCGAVLGGMEHFYHKQNMKSNPGMVFMEKRI